MQAVDGSLPALDAQGGLDHEPPPEKSRGRAL
jgi:hypothetical protein